MRRIGPHLTVPLPIRTALVTIGLCVAVGFFAVGVVGVTRYIQTFWLYRGFAAPIRPKTVVAGSGDHTHRVPVLEGAVHTVWLRVPALGGRRVSVIIYTPPGYAEHLTTRYPVLYLLHGYPGEPIQFVNIGDIAVTSDILIAEHRIRPMIFVMPAGSTEFFVDDEWVNAVTPHNDWDTYVARDVVDTIDHRYRTIATGAERGIGGLSEGGYGALNIAFHHVGEFDLVEAWSPYFTADASRRLFGTSAKLRALNSPLTELPLVAPELRARHAYIWIYTNAIGHARPPSEGFVDELKSGDVRYTFQNLPGEHNWHLWRRMMAPSLVTASEYFDHAQPAA